MTTVNSMDWEFPFGKYKGLSLKEAAKIDYYYCRWFMNNSKTFYFEGEIVDLVRNASNTNDGGPSSLQIDCERIECYS